MIRNAKAEKKSVPSIFVKTEVYVPTFTAVAIQVTEIFEGSKPGLEMNFWLYFKKY
jgi:hypothetical protein